MRTSDSISDTDHEETSFTKSSGWKIRSSKLARNTHNRIREIVESLKIEPNPEKPMIPLSIGDPTIFGNLEASVETINAVKCAIESGKYNGYAHTAGHEEARKAIVEYVAHQGPVTPNDIIICSGCSSALEICILTLADEGQNILVPRPGFCLYNTLCEGLGIEVRYYNLLPEKEWEADLEQMESLIDNNTASILINNPSNPCGSVFSKTHLQKILKLAGKYYLPIIADEIYEHFVFTGSKHIAISSLSKDVPILSCGGLTKRFLVPGWRTGWIVIHDRDNRLSDITKGLKQMAARILGSNTLVQGALPDILRNTPQSYFDGVLDILSQNAKSAYDALKDVAGLKPILPRGAMYMMVGIDIASFPSFPNDLEFVQDLVNEQSVFCLPGSCFEYPNYFRIVLTVPYEMIEEACSRISEFCEKHYKNDENLIKCDFLQPVSS
ncbi:tyrosine aminotransferase [Episyrphus balteatus]|uniref:tyrosine aminotransferase n=1 Tax=Episyrphus balteatus TaxID=286459 RepID=UPI002485B153|nr:tyrosine aminotransferase [Episyrphus balteatus]